MRKFILLCVVALLAFSCKEDALPVPPPFNPADLAFVDVAQFESLTGAPDSGEFTVKAPKGVKWSVASSAEWLTLTDNKDITGSGEAQEVAYVLTQNATLEPRTATLTLSITFNGEMESVTTTVTQGAGDDPAILAFVDVAQFESLSGALASGEFTVKAPNGVKWSVASSAEWLTMTDNTDITGSGSSQTVAFALTQNATLEPRMATLTLSATINGEVVSVTATVTQTAVPPLSGGIWIPNTNLYWAEGNLVADGANKCKIGSPDDYGLYFQFGGLIGWAGGANGDGMGTGSPAMTVSVRPTVMSSTPTAWNTTHNAGSSITGYGMFNYSTAPWDGKNQNIRDFNLNVAGVSGEGNLGTGKYAEIGVGDACTYYLGSKWRLPTAAEYKALFSDSPGGAWSTIPGWAWNKSPTSAYYSKYSCHFPASGRRRYSIGSLSFIGSGGYYWSSSVYDADNGYHLHFYSSSAYSQYYYNRSYGFPVRCVSDK